AVVSNNSAAARREIAFVDAAATNYQAIIADLRQDGRQVDVVLLHHDENGLEKISDVLAGYQDLDAVHLIAHGNQDGIQLGNTWLDANSLSTYAHDVRDWGEALGVN